MLARHAVSLTAPEAEVCLPSTTFLESRIVARGQFAQFWRNVTPFRINTYKQPASVDSKPLTASLSPLDATLTKNGGWGSGGEVNSPPQGQIRRAGKASPYKGGNNRLLTRGVWAPWVST